MGATTQAINSGDSWVTIGNRRGVFATVTMSSSYSTGGDTVTAAAFGLVTIDDIDILSQPSGYVLEFDKTNLKMKAYRTATLTPSGTVAAPVFTGSALAAHGHVLYVDTGATDATGARINAATNSLAMNNAAASIAPIATAATPGGIVQITAGTPAGTNSAPAFTGAATTAAALAQVGSTTDLSAVTARVFVMGW
jgi:hypothetical protein